jgi:hypothetical protein
VNHLVVVKIIELVGVSEKSWHDAVDNAIQEAARTVKNLRGVHVKKCTGKIKENKIIEYRATVKISFVVER